MKQVHCYSVILSILFISTCIPASEYVDIAVDDGNPPLMYQEDGVVRGLYPELLQSVFLNAGVTVNIAAYPWTRVAAMGEDGRVAVGGIYKTVERLKVFDYSAPLFSEKILIYVKKGRTLPYHSIQDFKGKKIGVIRGWSYGAEFDLVRSQGMFIITENASDYANFTLLNMGRLDAVLAIDVSAQRVKSLMKNRDDFDALPQPLVINETYLAFSKKEHRSNVLLLLFNGALARMKADGSYDRIINKYIQKDGAQSVDAGATDTLRIATMDLPPYGWVDSTGKKLGALYELDRDLAIHTGMPFVHEILPFGRMLGMLKDGTLDVISSQAHKDALEAGDSLAVRYTTNVIVVTRKGSGIRSVADLRGKSIVYHLSAFYAPLEGIPKTIVRVNNYRQSLQIVFEKRADAAVISEPAFYYWLMELGLSVNDFGTVVILESGKQQWLFVRKNLPVAIRNKLRTVVTDQRAEHAWESMLVKYSDP